MQSAQKIGVVSHLGDCCWVDNDKAKDLVPGMD